MDSDAPPNMPEPINGIAKSYDYSHRSFTRPYSAKTIYFYKEGDNYFEGVKMPVSKAKYRNMESLMDDLNDRVNMTYGVRRLYTPHGRTQVEQIDELEHMGKYIVSSSTKWARKLNMSAIERQHKLRMEAAEKERNHRRVQSHSDTVFASSSAALKEKERLKRVVNTRTPPTLTTRVPKQILFVLNGKATRVYRTLLRPPKMPQFDSLLTEVSEGLQVPIYKLYTFDGHKVLSMEEVVQNTRLLACQRHEQPHIDMVLPDKKFPPINQRQNHMVSNGEQKPRARSEGRPMVNGNSSKEHSFKTDSSVNSLPPLPRPPKSDKRTRFDPVPDLEQKRKHLNRKPTAFPLGPEPKQPKTEPKPPVPKPISLKNKRTISPKKASKRSTKRPGDMKRAYSGEHDKAATKIQAGIRGYLTRRGLSEEQEAAKKIQAKTRDYLSKKNESVATQEDSMAGCSYEMSARTLQTAFRAFRKWKELKELKRIKSKLAELDDQEVEQAAVTIQANFRSYRSRKYYKEQLAAAKKLRKINGAVARRATVSIQAAFRGYKVRKKYGRPKDVYDPYHSTSNLSASDLERQEQAATTIQASFRGFRDRKQVTKMRRSSHGADPAIKTKSKRAKKADVAKEAGNTVYSISVFTGNRWAADSDCDLFVILHGEKGESKKLWLKQSPVDPKFSQNQVDSFDVECPSVGPLKSIDVGHEVNGYGAGLFLERIIVVDTIEDFRQYVFFCGTWMDSGQVDGRLERSFNCDGYYLLNSMPEDKLDQEQSDEQQQPISKGRWAMTVHTGNANGDGGTTANLCVIGYGSFGHSDPLPISDENLTVSGTASIFELDFGPIGELYKIRVETDGTGSNPEYYLNAIGLKDMDTEEEMHLICDRWLSWPHPRRDESMAKIQPFRELSVVRVGMEILPVVNYTGKITVTGLRGSRLPGGSIELRLIGEFGDSGIFPIGMPPTNGGPIKQTEEISFTVECVTLGRLHHVTVWFPVDDSGDVFSEGFNALQEIYDKHNISVPAANDWVVQQVLIRESNHAPYRFLFGESRVSNTEPRAGCIQKDIMLTEMEGLSTKAKSTKVKTSDGRWQVLVTTGDHADAGTDAAPYVTMYGVKGKSKPTTLKKSSDNKNKHLTPGSTEEFELTTKDLGSIYKARLHMGDEGSQKTAWYLKKLKIKHEASGDEMRFPVEMWLDPESVVELPVVWPDIPPLPLLLYQVTVITGSESDNNINFTPFINIHGRKGDTGRRVLRNAVGTQSDSCFKPGNADTFEIEAVTLEKLDKVYIGFKEVEGKAGWFVDRVEVLDPDSGRLYIFECKDWLKGSKKDKRQTERSLELTRMVEEGQEG